MTLHANPVKHRPTGRNPQASASKGKQSYLGEAEKRKAERRKETRELRDGKLHSSYSAKTGHLLGNHSASPSLWVENTGTAWIWIPPCLRSSWDRIVLFRAQDRAPSWQPLSPTIRHQAGGVLRRVGVQLARLLFRSSRGCNAALRPIRKVTAVRKSPR